MESTLDRVIQANMVPDHSVSEMKQLIDVVATQITAMEQAASPHSTLTHADLCSGLLRPNGHRLKHRLRGVVLERIKLRSHPRQGEQSKLQTQQFVLSDDELPTGDHNFSHNIKIFGSRLPNSLFPNFDGENPKWWKKNCEKIL